MANGATEVAVEQQTFLLNAKDAVPDTLWRVPIMAIASDGSGEGTVGQNRKKQIK